MQVARRSSAVALTKSAFKCLDLLLERHRLALELVHALVQVIRILRFVRQVLVVAFERQVLLRRLLEKGRAIPNDVKTCLDLRLDRPRHAVELELCLLREGLDLLLDALLAAICENSLHPRLLELCGGQHDKLALGALHVLRYGTTFVESLLRIAVGDRPP